MVEKLLKDYFSTFETELEISSADLHENRGISYLIKCPKHKITLEFSIDFVENDCGVGYSSGFELFDSKKIDFSNFVLIGNNKNFVKEQSKFLRRKYGVFYRFKNINEIIEGYIEFYTKYLTSIKFN